MESGGRFEFQRDKSGEQFTETPQEKFLRILAAQHPVEKTAPQAEFTVLDIQKQIHPQDQQPEQ